MVYKFWSKLFSILNNTSRIETYFFSFEYESVVRNCGDEKRKSCH